MYSNGLGSALTWCSLLELTTGNLAIIARWQPDSFFPAYLLQRYNGGRSSQADPYSAVSSAVGFPFLVDTNT